MAFEYGTRMIKTKGALTMGKKGTADRVASAINEFAAEGYELQQVLPYSEYIILIGRKV